jgi:transposase
MDCAIARVHSRAVATQVQTADLASMLSSMPELAALLQAERAAMAARVAELEKERDNLRAAYERLLVELELLKRRLFIAKAERADNEEQLKLEFAEKMRELDKLAGTLGMQQPVPKPSDPKPAKDGKPRGKRTSNGGTGRRDLRDLALPEDRLEIADERLEALVREGKIKRHGFDESFKLGHRRATKVRVVIARVRYKTVDAEGDTDVITAVMPDEMLPGSLGAPSLMSHVIHENIGKGMPMFRLEDSFRRDGVAIDRATLCRWKHLIGDQLGKTVVKAMHEHALATAFCISTDATGVNVQPIYSHEKGRQPCKKGHFLVMIADRDHILYEYLERETGKAIYERFRGFDGFVQADAKSVFNLLFSDVHELKRKASDVEHDGCERTEVGCWYHCRKRFWEAAVAKSEAGREGLVRIARIFELDASWKGKPPSRIKLLRGQYLRPHVDSFFVWVEQQRELFKEQRGYVRTALEYAHNQAEVLQRFFDDGRLVLSNNGAERAIKPIAVGRKAWLFCGSDDHAKSTAVLFSLVASARLHGLDPEEYLRCLIRLVPLWPSDRMLELAPLFWSRTRARLDPIALDAELGALSIPAEPLDTTLPPEQQVAAG